MGCHASSPKKASDDEDAPAKMNSSARKSILNPDERTEQMSLIVRENILYERLMKNDEAREALLSFSKAEFSEGACSVSARKHLLHFETRLRLGCSLGAA